MSNTRYIEFDSTYRDRTRWPLPGEFEVQISQTGTKSKTGALDPISLATPLLIFNGEFDQSANTFDITGGSVSSTVAAPVSEIGNTTSPNILIVEFPAGELKTDEGFYNGAVMTITTTGGVEHQRISSYEFVNTLGASDRGKFTFLSGFSGNVVNGDAVVIANPSDNNPVNAQIFIATGSDANNFYIGEIIEDTNLGESRTITEYDGITHLATINSPFGGGWSATDEYVIRKEIPCEKGTLQNTTPSSNTISFLTPLTSTSNFLGDFLRMQSNSTANANEIRRIVKYQEPISGVLANGTTISQFSIPASSNGVGFSNQTGFYNDFFIEILTGVAAGDIRLITSYTVTLDGNGNVVSRIGIPDAVFTAGILPGDSFRIKGGIVSPAMPATITGAGQTYEILCFNRDNVVPMNYTGSTVSQQEEVCYEIELLNVILPNRTLVVGKGSRITFYPYIYVEFCNVSAAGAGTKGAIYSNNPNSNRMLFRVPVDDIPNPVLSPFIKLDGDGMVQTVKFKPNDNLKFGVYLPDGDVFEINLTETVSPQEPNPLMQISAMFSIKRL